MNPSSHKISFGSYAAAISGKTMSIGVAGEWHVIMACRDFLKAETAARKCGMSKDSYTVMHLDLASLESVRQFVDSFRHAAPSIMLICRQFHQFLQGTYSRQCPQAPEHRRTSKNDMSWCNAIECYRRSGRPLDVVVCNAAVYLPTAKEPRFTAEGFELSVGTNHLGHFLLANLLLEDLKERKKSAKVAPRMIIVGSITGNTNTVAGVHLFVQWQYRSAGSFMLSYTEGRKKLLCLRFGCFASDNQTFLC